jgi:hypothetical protein
MASQLPAGKPPLGRTSTSDHFPCLIVRPACVPGGELRRENNSSFIGASAALLKNRPTPSQYTSNWPLTVPTEAGSCKARRKSKAKPKRRYLGCRLGVSTTRVYGATSGRRNVEYAKRTAPLSLKSREVALPETWVLDPAPKSTSAITPLIGIYAINGVS